MRPTDEPVEVEPVAPPEPPHDEAPEDEERGLWPNHNELRLQP